MYDFYYNARIHEHQVLFIFLVGCLAVWLFGCFVSWLFGWLVGWLFDVIDYALPINYADRCSVSQQLGALQTHSSSFLTQRTYSCPNFVAISSLVLELLKKCRVR
jgi:hypothetical protein